MSARSPTKRGPSPAVSSLKDYAPEYAATGHHSGKRCRQLAPGSCDDWDNPPSNKAQLSTSLRRAQSANVGTTVANQQARNELDHWRAREGTRRPPLEQFDRVQTEVTPAMRTMLVDWLGEVRDEFLLQPETLFLAVSYLDRYLASRPAARQRFQLLGLVCLWVASKFEEVCPPSMQAMLAMAENMYSPDDMRAMEKEVLFTLDFGLAIPTSLRFLHIHLQLAPLPPQPPANLSVRRLAEALLELTLLDTAFLAAPPSHVAAGAVYLSLTLLRCPQPEALRAVVCASGAEPQVLGVLVQSLSMVLQAACAQPQPCALLLRYKAWEHLHREQVHLYAGQQAAVAPPQPPQPPQPPAAAGGAPAAVPATGAAPSASDVPAAPPAANVQSVVQQPAVQPVVQCPSSSSSSHRPDGARGRAGGGTAATLSRHHVDSDAVDPYDKRGAVVPPVVPHVYPSSGGGDHMAEAAALGGLQYGIGGTGGGGGWRAPTDGGGGGGGGGSGAEHRCVGHLSALSTLTLAATTSTATAACG